MHVLTLELELLEAVTSLFMCVFTRGGVHVSPATCTLYCTMYMYSNMYSSKGHPTVNNIQIMGMRIVHVLTVEQTGG